MSIKHVVVVMFENRSYDNVLGWLYNSSNESPYQTPPSGQSDLNGLTGSETNPDPNDPGGTITVGNQTTPTQIAGTGITYAPTAIPLIDPGEPFSDMAQQILSLASVPTSNPYTDYPPSSTSNLMQGFTTNYASLSGDSHPNTPVPAANIPDIMNYLTPAQMPVTAFLANNYAVCDQWFASVPTQTFTNRAFAFCAAPAVDANGEFSLIDDLQYYTDSILTIPSVLSQLDAVLGAAGGSGPFWKVYFQDYSIAAITVPQVATAAASTSNSNLATFDNSDWGSATPKQLTSVTTTFIEDLANGTLPPFSFIEPRYFDSYAPSGLPSACNHPGQGNFPGGLGGAKTPIDVATGEVFLMQLYNLLQGSSIWDETLFIITYDEHGGVFDHVPPPVATPPGGTIPAANDDGDSAANGFNYNLFGGRVPAIIVSPLIAAGSTIRDAGGSAFDHASIVSTVWDLFGLANGSEGLPSLTNRDLNAPSLTSFLASDATNSTGAFSGTIVAGAGSLTFTHDKGLPSQPAAQFILASAGPSVAFTTTVSQPEGESWLSVSSSGTGLELIDTITVNVNVDGLAEATYTGTVVIAGDAANSPLNIPVTLIVRSIF
jgi:phospholipase C